MTLDGKKIVEEIERKILRASKPVLCNVSNRHVHITEEDFRHLFGATYGMRKMKDLLQPGEYASKERVEISGPKGSIKNVRILGPFRKFTQVELSRTDSYKLGLDAPVSESGNLDGAADIELAGPSGLLKLKKAAIVARRHIHMTPSDAGEYEVENGQFVRIELPGFRGGILGEVLVRVSLKYTLECHIDTDEANAFDFKSGGYIYIV